MYLRRRAASPPGGTTVRMPYACQPQACRTYRVTVAPQVPVFSALLTDAEAGATLPAAPGPARQEHVATRYDSAPASEPDSNVYSRREQSSWLDTQMDEPGKSTPFNQIALQPNRPSTKSPFNQ